MCRFLNQICENKSEICRKFWNLWELFIIIQNYSLHFLVAAEYLLHFPEVHLVLGGQALDLLEVHPRDGPGVVDAIRGGPEEALDGEAPKEWSE